MSFHPNSERFVTTVGAVRIVIVTSFTVGLCIGFMLGVLLAFA